MHAVAGASLAVLTWDPQLRGALIVLVGVGVLCGSVYLVLATNVGARIGLLLAVAGLSGWLLLLNVVWISYGIGYKGSANGWVPKEIVTGDLLTHSGIKAVVGTPGRPGTQFPNGGWRLLPPTNSLLVGATPAAGTALIPPTAGNKPTSGFAPPFATSQDYVSVAGYAKGGHNYLVNLFGYKIFWRIRAHYVYLKHQPDFIIVRVSPALPSVTLAGAASTLPAADVSKPITSVVLERNVGSLRLPPILIGLSSLIVFGLTVEKLHSRDNEIARRKAAEAGGGKGPSGGAPPKPAGELQPA